MTAACIPAGLMLLALVAALIDGPAIAATIGLDAWRAYFAASGLAWREKTMAMPAGEVVRFLTDAAPGVSARFYGPGFDLDAATRYHRGPQQIAAAERRPHVLVVAEALCWQYLADHPEALDAAPEPAIAAALAAASPANDTAYPAEEAVPIEPSSRKDPPPVSLDAFLRLRPRLLDVLAREARAEVVSGAGRVGTKALFERLRADVDLYREACGGTLPPRLANAAGPWRLNNTHTAAVARLLAARAPDLARYLDLRRSRADFDPIVVGRVASRSTKRRAPRAS